MSVRSSGLGLNCICGLRAGVCTAEKALENRDSICHVKNMHSDERKILGVAVHDLKDF